MKTKLIAAALAAGIFGAGAFSSPALAEDPDYTNLGPWANPGGGSPAALRAPSPRHDYGPTNFFLTELRATISPVCKLRNIDLNLDRGEWEPRRYGFFIRGSHMKRVRMERYSGLIST